MSDRRPNVRVRRGTLTRATLTLLPLTLAAVAVAAPGARRRHVITVDVDRTGERPSTVATRNAPSISSTGRYVCFSTEAEDISDDDADATLDVFARDIFEGRTILVSRGSVGDPPANGDSWGTRVSANEQVVVFNSRASNLAPLDENGTTDVFVRNLANGTTALVSAATAGGGTGDGESRGSVVSGDGRFIVFRSDATNLVDPPISGPGGQVYLRDTLLRTTVLVSASVADGGPSDARSDDDPYMSGESISADGRFVAFASPASDLVPDDTNGASDVFVRDVNSGTTTLVSRPAESGGTGNGRSGTPAMTPDGRFVVFVSDASDLVPDDRNGERDVFMYDMRRGSLFAISESRTRRGTAGGRSDAQTFGAPAVSSNGRYVAFLSNASDISAWEVPESGAGFVRDVRRRRTFPAAVAPRGRRVLESGYPILSSNGEVVAFIGYGVDDGLFVRHTSHRRVQRLHSYGRTGLTISANGRWVAFLTGYPGEIGSVVAQRVR